ncbi:MAG: hypothetical protein KAS30_01530 [Candidatus Diapherotrites archaeon]|nr:hypothetical protein [Candidatus Diapherotrites archaeon]
MEFQVSKVTYRAEKISAMNQLLIVKRLTCVLGDLAPAFKNIPKLPNGKPDVEKLKGMDSMKFLPDFAKAVHGLSDDDFKYCIYGLLGAVKKKAEGDVGWFDIYVEGAGFMFEAEMTPYKIVQIAFKSFWNNLNDFFQEMSSALKEDTQTQKTQSNG